MGLKGVNAIQWEGDIESEESIAEFMGEDPIVVEDTLIVNLMTGPGEFWILAIGSLKMNRVASTRYQILTFSIIISKCKMNRLRKGI